VSLPSSIRINVSDYVSLEMDTDEPYRYDSDVIKKGGGPQKLDSGISSEGSFRKELTMSKKRTQYPSEFKAKVALAACETNKRWLSLQPITASTPP